MVADSVGADWPCGNTGPVVMRDEEVYAALAGIVAHIDDRVSVRQIEVRSRDGGPVLLVAMREEIRVCCGPDRDELEATFLDFRYLGRAEL
jgi:hypothetical protein